MSDKPVAGRPWAPRGLRRILATTTLAAAIIAIFVPIGDPHLDLVLIAALALAVLL